MAPRASNMIVRCDIESMVWVAAGNLFSSVQVNCVCVYDGDA